MGGWILRYCCRAKNPEQSSALDRSLYREEGKPSACRRQIEVQCWEFLIPVWELAWDLGIAHHRDIKIWILQGATMRSTAWQWCRWAVVVCMILHNKKTCVVTMLYPVSVRQLKLEKVEEGTQKPDESYESPFRPCRLFHLFRKWETKLLDFA